jgi:23S rRNA (cytidine1920-2'-O)/16S rRNA (cytidine1409-2'-O)-methyltransferase
MRVIATNLVQVSGSIADKPSRLVDPGEPIVLLVEKRRFVSRGGTKLDGALECFGIDVADSFALDAGASTGGFTHCLLTRGAKKVIAIDVGTGQIDQSMRNDRRVILKEKTHIKTVSPQLLRSWTNGLEERGGVDVVVADLSFMSLRGVAVTLTSYLAQNGALVLLVKPQFEVGKVAVSRGKGVIRDPLLWRQALGEVADAVIDAGNTLRGVTPSSIKGAKGNVEFFLWAGPPGPLEVRNIGPMLDSAVQCALESEEHRV